MNASAVAPSIPAEHPPTVPAQDTRLAHLFRASRRAGVIHPLQHLIQQYRAGVK